jgi:hypothetical protein
VTSPAASTAGAGICTRQPWTRPTAARGGTDARSAPRSANEQNEPTGAWLAAPVTVERGLCDGCRRDLEHALNHLVGDVVELTMMIGRVGSTGDVLVSSSPELQIPLQVNVEALRAEIDSELQNWAETGRRKARGRVGTPRPRAAAGWRSGCSVPPTC